MRFALVLTLPLIIAWSCRALAWLPPLDAVWGQALVAVLLTLPRWLMFAWPLWAALVGLRTRRWLEPLLAAAAGLLMAGAPHPGAGARGPVPEGGWRVLSANVNAFSDDDDVGALEAALGAEHADVLMVFERRALKVPGMVRVADDFDEDMPRVSHATAVFCREGVPCQAVVTEQFGSDSSRMPLALVRLGDLCLLGIHAPPPVPRNATGNLPYVQRVAEAIEGGRMARTWGPCEVGDRVVLAGDLNQVPHSLPWRLLLGAGLVDAVESQGVWAATWPAGGGWPDLPVFRLDQVMVGAASVGGVRALRVPGSDHKALVFWTR